MYEAVKLVGSRDEPESRYLLWEQSLISPKQLSLSKPAGTMLPKLSKIWDDRNVYFYLKTLLFLNTGTEIKYFKSTSGPILVRPKWTYLVGLIQTLSSQVGPCFYSKQVEVS